jgi:hypothetical protein
MNEPEPPIPKKTLHTRPRNVESDETNDSCAEGLSLVFRDSQGKRREIRTRLRQAILLGIANAVGELPAFTCSACGKVGLDPCGFNGPAKPLCEKCADGEAP